MVGSAVSEMSTCHDLRDFAIFLAPWIPRLGKDLMPSLVTRNEHLGDKIILTCDRKLPFSHIIGII